MIIVSILGALVPIATSYAIIKITTVATKEMLVKERPITTIKFKEWSAGK